MAYQSKNTEEVLNSFQLGDCSELRVTEVRDEDGVVQSFDLRTWYCTKSDPEMKPTKRGVRIRADLIEDVIMTIQNAL